MIKEARFLIFKPSQIAAAAFMLALNANLDTPIAKALEIDHNKLDKHYKSARTSVISKDN